VSYEFVHYEKRGRVAIVTLDRPEVLNSIHPPTSAELDRVWDDFASDDEVWIAILTGTGRAFCTGNDLKYLAEHGLGGPPAKGGFGGLTHRLDLWKPVIAAVNGHAVAGGMELALACDLIVAGESAKFGLVEPRRGLAPLAGGIHRLPRQLPMKLAMELILTARTFSAQKALELALVNQLVPDDEVLPAALQLADEILECAPLSIQACKQGVMMGMELPLGEALTQRYPAIGKLLHSEDFQEGPRAFVERRDPRWTGR
jgi:enoyl-CoA hydratase/carnithine racemase